MKWRATHDHHSEGHDLVRGQILDIPTWLAEWYNRDSPGLLEPMWENEPPPKPPERFVVAKSQAPPEPEEDRMVKTPTTAAKRGPGRPRTSGR